MATISISISLWVASLRGELQYRANFLIMALMGIVYQCTGFAFIWVVLARFQALAGWTLGEVAFLYGLRLIMHALKGANIGNIEVVGTEIVGPSVGQQLTRQGTLATVLALAGILAYVAFRFQFSFAVGAVVATVHDLLVTLAFLAFFRYDLSLNVVAAILTITGYSVNDTIVIFDRVRENMRTKRRDSLEKVVNESVNQTLSRTIITAGTTFLAVLALYLFGGEVLEGFAL